MPLFREAGVGRVLGAIMKECKERMEGDVWWQHCKNEKDRASFFCWLWCKD